MSVVPHASMPDRGRSSRHDPFRPVKRDRPDRRDHEDRIYQRRVETGHRSDARYHDHQNKRAASSVETLSSTSSTRSSWSSTSSSRSTRHRHDRNRSRPNMTLAKPPPAPLADLKENLYPRESHWEHVLRVINTAGAVPQALAVLQHSIKLFLIRYPQRHHIFSNRVNIRELGSGISDFRDFAAFGTMFGIYQQIRRNRRDPTKKTSRDKIFSWLHIFCNTGYSGIEQLAFLGEKSIFRMHKHDDIKHFNRTTRIDRISARFWLIVLAIDLASLYTENKSDRHIRKKRRVIIARTRGQSRKERAAALEGLLTTKELDARKHRRKIQLWVDGMNAGVATFTQFNPKMQVYVSIFVVLAKSISVYGHWDRTRKPHA